MLLPKKTKYRKSHKNMAKGIENRGTSIDFGRYAIKATSFAWVDSRQIEAARRAMTRYIKRGGKIWIRIFPDKPVTKLPAEVTMGGGKGNIDRYVCQVRPGRIMFEMDGVPEDIAKEALRLGTHKLPLRTKIIVKETGGKKDES
jgi:large subunit ribosomal protein L16